MFKPACLSSSLDARSQALAVLCVADPTEKCVRTHQLQQASVSGLVPIDPELTVLPQSEYIGPGRPERPLLIDPADVPTRSPFTTEGLAALVHAVCHIEFNAINLALDAVWRFANMPQQFYSDWLRIAAEEAYHFRLLHERLMALRGADGTRWVYGSFPAHDGLWSMCEKTASDIVARMALVPRTLEARGLDATPLIQAKLRKVGTTDALAVCDALDIILREEVGHVAIGNHWYGHLCQQQQLDPIAHYKHLAKEYQAPRLKPPFNTSARLKAGFSETEIAYLAAI
jgi:uncharacterized ferritin-like protein (DUF455 family)